MSKIDQFNLMCLHPNKRKINYWSEYSFLSEQNGGMVDICPLEEYKIVWSSVYVQLEY